MNAGRGMTLFFFAVFIALGRWLGIPAFTDMHPFAVQAAAALGAFGLAEIVVRGFVRLCILGDH